LLITTSEFLLSFGVNINSFEEDVSELRVFEKETFNSVAETTSTFFIVNLEAAAGVFKEVVFAAAVAEKVAVSSGEVTSFNSESNADTAI
jgi:glutamate synthase domain-containing protein 1